MLCRLIAVAAFAVGLAVTAAPARADCLWDVGMAELDLRALERAAPLASDPTLPLGPGGPDRLSGAERDFADRAMLAFGASSPVEESEARPGVIEGRITWARNRLDAARSHASVSDMEACAAALDRARQAIAGARAAFR